jgi:hypothetical protein
MINNKNIYDFKCFYLFILFFLIFWQNISILFIQIIQTYFQQINKYQNNDENTILYILVKKINFIMIITY